MISSNLVVIFGQWWMKPDAQYMCSLLDVWKKHDVLADIMSGALSQPRLVLRIMPDIPNCHLRYGWDARLHLHSTVCSGFCCLLTSYSCAHGLVCECDGRVLYQLRLTSTSVRLTSKKNLFSQRWLEYHWLYTFLCQTSLGFLYFHLVNDVNYILTRTL